MGLFILLSLNSFSILDLLFELLFLLESAATPTYYFRPILKISYSVLPCLGCSLQKFSSVTV